MKTKLRKSLAMGIAVMGLVHIVATFTPVIAGQLAPLTTAGQQAFTYMSLMCGALLILGGLLIFMLSDKQQEAPFLRKPLRLIEAVLVIDGILAVCLMPTNPCAWIIQCLVLPLPFTNNQQ